VCRDFGILCRRLCRESGPGRGHACIVCKGWGRLGRAENRCKPILTMRRPASRAGCNLVSGRLLTRLLGTKRGVCRHPQPKCWTENSPHSPTGELICCPRDAERPAPRVRDATAYKRKRPRLGQVWDASLNIPPRSLLAPKVPASLGAMEWHERAITPLTIDQSYVSLTSVIRRYPVNE